MKTLTLYHGSSDIIKKPTYGKGKIYNDYGQGFYCTENADLAREWACLEATDGYVNKYTIGAENISVLNLCDSSYSILHWMTILIENRKFRISTPIMHRGIEWLKTNFHLDTTPYDAILGYRADDSYFSFARSFLSNQISLAQLSYAMKLGKLGEQFALISRKAFDSVHFEGYEAVDSSIYYVKRKARDGEARSSYLKMLEKEDENGVYLRDMTNGRVNRNEL